MAKILVTGINGFVGYHVATELHNSGFKVLGTGNQPTIQANLKNFVDEYVGCDLTNVTEVAKLDLSEVDAIINLAGFAKVGESKDQGELYNKVNIGVHTTLYEECLKQRFSPRIIVVSTGAVYDPNQELPITEESALINQEKTNEYVISKQLMEEAVASLRLKGLEIIIARPFNHSGPGQLPGFLLPDLGEQIDTAVAQKNPLLVGNLDTKRDFTDVRDVAKAYVALATLPKEKLHYDLYNICSGISVSGREILNYLLEAYDVPNLETKIDPKKLRKNDIMNIYGSSEKLQKDTGWKPEISIEKMVKDFVAWQKSR
jgi:GDP-4-dehydro-6-deoxy-D-mannose reductase